jgi:hypothetical protein
MFEWRADGRSQKDQAGHGHGHGHHHDQDHDSAENLCACYGALHTLLS